MRTLLLSLFAICSLFAGWEDAWTEGVSCCITRDWEGAEKHFTEAICLLGADHVLHPHVWVDRARLYLILGKNHEALSDLTFAFESPHLKDDDYKRALLTLCSVHLQLGLEEEAKEDMKEYHELYPAPELEFYESKIIIRNIPDCECSNNMLKKYLGNVFCDSEDDVIISNGICIAKRKASCQCFVGHERPPTDAKASCREWCDDFATGGDLFCSRTFKTFPCQAACVGTVQALKKGCHWCCNGGNFYGDCVKPFADILGQMGGFCDPAWD